MDLPSDCLLVVVQYADLAAVYAVVQAVVGSRVGHGVPLRHVETAHALSVGWGRGGWSRRRGCRRSGGTGAGGADEAGRGIGYCLVSAGGDCQARVCAAEECIVADHSFRGTGGKGEGGETDC